MQLLAIVNTVLGLDQEPRDLTFLQVSVRGVIVFVVTLIVVRLANKRFLAKMTAFDAILGFMLASMMARAINGSAPFFPTLGAGFVLIGVHRLLGTLAFHSDRFGALVKGGTEVLVKDGKPRPEAMRTHNISEHDLLEEARLNGRVTRVEDIQTATLERSGEVSIIPKSS